MKVRRLNKTIKKIIVLLMIILLNSFNFMKIVNAESTNVANIYKAGDCGKLLTYKGSQVRVFYVEYVKDGIHFPAYCLDKTKPGPEGGSYDVDISQKIHDVGLWRVLINGYPYKTLEELGVNSKEEAFSATKQAIYCYIHNNKLDDYGAIGEAGKRTLNALKKIVHDANSSNEVQISNIINIERLSDKWQQDEKDNKYISRLYKINSKAQIEDYKVKLEIDKNKILEDEIKITDIENIEKEYFKPNEAFKILIPINKLKEEGKIKINIETKVKTKPVLYGKAPNSSLQDHAITTFSYEEGIGSVEEKYLNNDTKIIIIKKDQENGLKLEGVEFQLLDKDNKVIYSDLKTDKDGKIEIKNILPGKYYIKEINALEGYEKNDKLVEVDIKLNQEYKVTINNLKKEEPKVEKEDDAEKEVNNIPEKIESNVIEKPEKIIENNKVLQIKRLPKTGM